MLIIKLRAHYGKQYLSNWTHSIFLTLKSNFPHTEEQKLFSIVTIFDFKSNATEELKATERTTWIENIVTITVSKSYNL